MKRFLQNTGAAASSQKNTKDTAPGSSAALQDTSVCWEHSTDVEREATSIDSYWYLATWNFCAEQLHLKTVRARSHPGCITGQNVRICSRVPPEIRDHFGQPIIVVTVRLQDTCLHT